MPATGNILTNRHDAAAGSRPAPPRHCERSEAIQLCFAAQWIASSLRSRNDDGAQAGGGPFSKTSMERTKTPFAGRPAFAIAVHHPGERPSQVTPAMTATPAQDALLIPILVYTT